MFCCVSRKVFTFLLENITLPKFSGGFIEIVLRKGLVVASPPYRFECVPHLFWVFARLEIVLILLGKYPKAKGDASEGEGIYS